MKSRYVTQHALAFTHVLSIRVGHCGGGTVTHVCVLQLVLPEKKMRLLVETVRAPNPCPGFSFCPCLHMYSAVLPQN